MEDTVFSQWMQELGFTDPNFWLFGSTGNYTDLGGEEQGLDNILYGIKDVDFPYFNPDARFGLSLIHI